VKVVGFTFIRNAVKYDYPVVEAIRSVLPMCDEFVVNVGDSEDNTVQLIENIAPSKIRIVHSVWDPALLAGGTVLAEETNKAYAAIADNADWCFYIQADEVIHEKYHRVITEAMKFYKDDRRVEGLLLKYLHFYGSYDYIGDSRRWYSHEIRVIRKDPNISSYRDAQGFRIAGRKMNVKEIDAYVYHYGWVKHPETQMRKILGFEQLYSNSEMAEKVSKETAQTFNYSEIDSLKRFTETHPKVMQERIASRNWTFDYDISRKNFSLKGWLLHLVERLTGKRLFEYRNYRKI
jgi:hypothetical protein